jgi:dethiobiotin synthetase
MSHGLFITGTDTGVGKTLVACALLHALAQRAMRVTGMKPVAAGAQAQSGRLVNEDVTALKAAGNVEAPERFVNPYCFEPPIAPHIAARMAGVAIDLACVRSAFLELAALSDCVIVEGAGGFCVPLGPDLDTAQLARALDLPVLLVVGMRLGCLNHALLTARTIAGTGLKLAGWVANHIDPHMLHPDENVAALSERLAAPLIARIGFNAQHDARTLAREMRAGLLI